MTTRIANSAWLGARALQLAFPLFPATPKDLQHAAQREIARTEVIVPTRHGAVRCLLYHAASRAATVDPSAVYVNFHGGGFIVRAPDQDDHVCRFIASAMPVFVISVDYHTAPQVQYPVAEEESYDVVDWVYRNGPANGWNSRRLGVGGFSAGAKLAINVCQQARDRGEFMPEALIMGYGPADMTLTVADRHSPSKTPAVPRWLISLMENTYFADRARRHEPLASPGLDHNLRGFPPTLILTGDLDIMTAENARLAENLDAQGVAVCYRCFANSDHGFTHNKPLEVAREAMDLVVSQLRRYLLGTLLAADRRASIASASRPGSG